MGVAWTFFLSSILFSALSPSLWETARYRLKYCLKGPLSPKQPTNNNLDYRRAGGGRVVRWCWVNFQCRGVLQFGLSRARAYCTCSRCGWGVFGHFYSHLYFFSPLSPTLWETEVLSQRSVKPKTTNYRRARAYCAYSRCGRELFGHFYSPLCFLSSFSLSLGDGPI